MNRQVQLLNKDKPYEYTAMVTPEYVNLNKIYNKGDPRDGIIDSISLRAEEVEFLRHVLLAYDEVSKGK